MGIDTVYEQDMQTAHIIQPAEEMAAIIQQFDNIVIVAHGSPDGDAIGATGAMGSLVKALGKRFVLYNATGIPDYLEWVPLPGKLVTKPSAIPFKPGLIIVLDCGDAWRMGKELLAVFPEYPSVNIDHHLGNPMFASLGNWVDPGNRCKLSLRSSGSDDVRSVAALFGGGGHLNAAGATIDDADMDAVTRQTIKAIQDITFGAGKEEKR